MPLRVTAGAFFTRTGPEGQCPVSIIIGIIITIPFPLAASSSVVDGFSRVKTGACENPAAMMGFPRCSKQAKWVSRGKMRFSLKTPHPG